MLRKILLATALAILPLACKANWVGLEGQFNLHKHDRAVHVIPHVNAIYGFCLNKHLGLEFGGYFLGMRKLDQTILRKNGVHATLLGYIPICDTTRLKLGFGGVQFLGSTKDNHNNLKGHSRLLPRVMAGVDVDMCYNLVGRMNIVWEQASMMQSAHRMFKNDFLNLNVGLAYTF